MTSDVPNLWCVDQKRNILRGGDPSLRGWCQLRDMGITDVVKLNTRLEGSDVHAEVLWLRVHRIPIPLWRQTIWTPRQRDIVRAVSLMVPNTYTHCERGEDRTGLVVGCYRLSMGMDKEEASAELLSHGFHPSLIGLKRCWNRQVASEWREWRETL